MSVRTQKKQHQCSPTIQNFQVLKRQESFLPPYILGTTGLTKQIQNWRCRIRMKILPHSIHLHLYGNVSFPLMQQGCQTAPFFLNYKRFLEQRYSPGAVALRVVCAVCSVCCVLCGCVLRGVCCAVCCVLPTDSC